MAAFQAQVGGGGGGGQGREERVSSGWVMHGRLEVLCVLHGASRGCPSCSLGPGLPPRGLRWRPARGHGAGGAGKGGGRAGRGPGEEGCTAAGMHRNALRGRGTVLRPSPCPGPGFRLCLLPGPLAPQPFPHPLKRKGPYRPTLPSLLFPPPPPADVHTPITHFAAISAGDLRAPIQTAYDSGRRGMNRTAAPCGSRQHASTVEASPKLLQRPWPTPPPTHPHETKPAHLHSIA